MRTLLIAGALAGVLAGCGGSGKVALPEGFPADLPAPPGGRLRVAQDLGARGLNLVWDVPGDPARFAADQRAGMEASGWAEVAEVALQRGTVRTWRKGARTAAVAFVPGAAGGTLSIGYLAPPGAGEGGAVP